MNIKENTIDIIEEKLDSIGCVIVYSDVGDNPMCLCPQSVLNNPPRWFDVAIQAGDFQTGSFQDYGTCDNCGCLIDLSFNDYIKRDKELICTDCLILICCTDEPEKQKHITELVTLSGVPFVWVGPDLFIDGFCDEIEALELCIFTI